MELTADALNSFSNVLPSGFFNKISESVGIPVDKTKTAMMTAIPAVFTELQKKIRNPENIQSVANAIHDSGFDQTTSLTSDSSNITSQVNKGQDLLKRLLGGDIDSLLGRISSHANVNTSVASKLLGAASTAVFAFIGSKMKNGSLPPAAFANILGQGTGFMPDLSHVSATASSVSAPVSAPPITSRKIWPWLLLAVVIGIIWWTQGRNSVPVLSSTTGGFQQADSKPVPAAAGTTAMAGTDQSVLSEFAQFLANPAALSPRTFSLRQLNFVDGSSALSIEGQSTATAIAALLEQYPETRIRMIGHTDKVGSEIANQQLSFERALALKAALVAQGIAADRIEVAGMGSTQPVADNATLEGRALNRRIDLEIIQR
jgi:outer membrane protein OmpA-like peptidoglycan-associated protein